MRRPLSIETSIPSLVRSLTFVVVWAAVMVILLDLWLHLTGLIPFTDLARLFDSTSETGLGSWIAVTQAALIALTLWGFAALARSVGKPRRHVAAWLALALFFSYLALDDGTRLHERVGTAFADSDASSRGLGAQFPSYFWQLLFGPGLLAMGAFTFAFLWRQNTSASARGRLILAFGLLATAVAMDFVDGLYEGHPMNLNAQLGAVQWIDVQSQRAFALSGVEAVQHLSRSIEESMEIVAMGLLWGLFLLAGARLTPGIQVQWDGTQDETAAPPVRDISAPIAPPRPARSASGARGLAASP